MPETPDGPCPSAGALWAAARGELLEAQLESLATHLRSCALCGEALALSADLAEETEPRTEHPPMPLRSRWTRLGAGAVSLAALAAGFAVMHLQRGSPPAAGELVAPVAIRALSPEEQPRAAIRLAWTPVERAVRYRVQVSSEDLQPLYGRTVERDTSLHLPASIASGGAGAATGAAQPARRTILHWQVDALFPDGRVSSSPTFTLRLVEPTAPAP